MSPAEPLLRVENLSVDFETPAGRVDAVAGVSFDLDRGRTLGIVGESGSGKTATALSLLGLSGPAARVSGRALLAGRDLLSVAPRELRAIRGREAAMIFQDPLDSLHPLHRVGDQVAEALRAHDPRRPRAGARGEAVELLAKVGLADPEGVARAHPHELSGGMRQRAMIAIAIANRPSLLIADEPTSALDTTTQARILTLLGLLQAELGMAMVLISHDLGVVARAADEVAVMRAGRIVEHGPAEATLRAPRHPYTSRLVDLARARGASAAGRRPPATGRPLLEVEGLVQSFARGHAKRGGEARIAALDGVDLTLAAGEVLAVVGESGSGKSTLCRAVLRLLEPTAGSVRFDGLDVTRASRGEMRRFRRRAQMVFQDPLASLNPRRRAGEAVAEPLRVHGIARGGVLERSVAAALERAGLQAAHRDRYPHELSGGERQRVGLARALAVEPALLVADEPVSALDAPVRARILALLGELRERLGTAMLVVSHDLDLLAGIADRIAVMHMGRIVEAGPAAEVASSPLHPYTRALLDARPVLPPAPRTRTAVARGLPLTDPPAPGSPPPRGCRYHPRCPLATPICAALEPPAADHGGARAAACHHPLTRSSTAGA